ncbi:transmembrane protein 14C-like [Artemia franciscana]|uniref:Transmembrane protein 14C n=1 Tax=Artemia franciscana TaxID=6661 RepID=A0AA88LFX4_ARTSF|nr:hypothetical protein QYM36_003245 [Artemia franciscana]
MASNDYLTYGYAALVAGGGIIGYVKAGSVPSLAMGLLFGSLLGLGAYQLSNNPNNYYLTMGASAVLGGVMGQKFFKTYKVFPAGAIFALSALTVGRLALRAYSVKKQ